MRAYDRRVRLISATSALVGGLFAVGVIGTGEHATEALTAGCIALGFADLTTMVTLLALSMPHDELERLAKTTRTPRARIALAIVCRIDERLCGRAGYDPTIKIATSAVMFATAAVLTGMTPNDPAIHRRLGILIATTLATCAALVCTTRRA